MGGQKKKPRRVRPYEKVFAWLEDYEKKCIISDIPMIDRLKDIYEPIIVKRGNRHPQLSCFLSLFAH
jgi:hypothetical protein